MYDSQTALVNHLQDEMEKERIIVARLLHDELGGLLVSAVMDLGWVEHHLETIDDIRLRLGRVRDTLACAIDMKRNMIEELRPSLLDNMGLFAACQWYLKQCGNRVGVLCTHRFPVQELSLKPAASTGLFRIIKETVALVCTEPEVKSIEVSMAVEADTLRLQIYHAHHLVETTDVLEHLPLAIAAITHRVTALGGLMTIQRGTAGTDMSSSFPLSTALAAA